MGFMPVDIFGTITYPYIDFIGLDVLRPSLAHVRFKQHQVHHTDASETTSVTKTPEHHAAKPNVEKALGSSMPFLADATIYQILRNI